MATNNVAPSGGQFGDLQYASVSPFLDPNFGNLYGSAQGSIPTSMNSLAGLIQGSVNSPLLQAILGPALTRLMGTEQASRDKVTDAFRSSGGLRSSQYGRTFAENERNIMGERGNLISDTIAKTLGTLVPGQLQEQRNMFLPSEAYNNLLKTIRPDVVSGVQRPAQSSSSGYNDPFGVLSGNQPFGSSGANASNPFAFSGGGGGYSGVNYKPNPLPVNQPYYPAYGPGSEPVPMGTPYYGGNAAPSYNPPLQYDYGNGWGNPPSQQNAPMYDQWGYGGGDWMSDPYYGGGSQYASTGWEY